MDMHEIISRGLLFTFPRGIATNLYSNLFKLVSMDSESEVRVEDPDQKVAELGIEGWEMFSFFLHKNHIIPNLQDCELFLNFKWLRTYTQPLFNNSQGLHDPVQV